ncbi:MAG: hypothetical protein C0P65_011690, partial [Lysobacteraceae bacterium]
MPDNFIKHYPINAVWRSRRGPISATVFGGVTRLMTLVYGAVSSFILLYAEERDIGNAGLFAGAFAAAVLTSRIFGGRLADVHGRW